MANEAPKLSPCTPLASCSKYSGWPKFGGMFSQPPAGLVITYTQLLLPLLPQPRVARAMMDPSPLIAAVMGRLRPSGSRVDTDVHTPELFFANTVVKFK